MFLVWIYFASIHIFFSTADRRLNDYHVLQLNDKDFLASAPKSYYPPESDFYENNKFLHRIRRPRRRTQHLLITPLDFPRNIRGYDNNENDYASDAPAYLQLLLNQAGQALSLGHEKRHHSSENEELIKILIKLLKLFNRRRLEKVKPISSINHIIISQPAVQTETPSEFQPPSNAIDFCKNQQTVASIKPASNGFPPSTVASLSPTNLEESPQQTPHSRSSESPVPKSTDTNVDSARADTSDISVLSPPSTGLSHQPSSKFKENSMVQSENKSPTSVQKASIDYPAIRGLQQLVGSSNPNFGEQGHSIYTGYSYRSMENHAEVLPTMPIKRPNMITGASITELPSLRDTNSAVTQNNLQNVLPGTRSLSLTPPTSQPDNSEIQTIQNVQQILPQSDNQPQTGQQTLPHQPQILPLTLTQQNVVHTSQNSQSLDVDKLSVNSQTQSVGQQQQQTVPRHSNQPIQQTSQIHSKVALSLPPIFAISKIGDYDWDYNTIHPSRSQRWDSKNYAVKHKLLEQIRRALSY
ncbi:hypothetical protein EWB00_003095 [Schistosoma japonicum]|uniref:Uncharacterized protein n=1 Tax=Schistosoma japonicum TaxID=6182 RepID=A0A4Z2D9Z3_SCHJA|nr:hypothetical protein EWB00_003095 [Schistosoma japonicum]